MANPTHGTMDDATLLSVPTTELSRLRGQSMLLCLVGVAISAAIGAVGLAFGKPLIEPGVIWQSYLIAYVFWIGVTLGPLAILMIQHLTGGAWTYPSRRILEAATRNLPLMAILFIPIAMNLPALYEWARPVETLAEERAHLVHLKAAYLNAPFFYLRAVIYFAVWGALIFLLNKWSREQDQHPPLPPGPATRRFRLLSAPGLVLYVLTVTFMSVDWIMSLDPTWYSTIFGILTMGGQGLSTMALTIVVLSGLVKTRPISQVASADNFHDLGKLMFAFLMLWAYFSVSQLLIIWSANLPEEVPFYLERLHGAWAPISIAILLLQFVLPFVLLLSRDLKRNPAAVKWVAVLILIMRVVDIAWTIGPVFRKEGSSLHWLDLALTFAMGAVWLALFWRNLAGRALIPAHDPYFKEAVAHGGH
jgi:hypothetical protein